MQTETTKEDPLDVFKGILEDVIKIGKALAPHCTTVEEMVALCEHGVENTAQRRLLMKETLGKR